jgi:hypothetical protein
MSGGHHIRSGTQRILGMNGLCRRSGKSPEQEKATTKESDHE